MKHTKKATVVTTIAYPADACDAFMPRAILPS